MILKIPSLSSQKLDLLESVVSQLSRVPGMLAVVLGGSHASGTAHAGSDIDLGLYYDPAQPFAIAEIRKIAESISLDVPPTVTDFYGWGPWVNGGAWVHTALGKVDFIYRNLDQVNRTLEEAEHGIWQHDYDQQPAYGFYSIIYLAETSVCVPLHDPQAVIAELKQRVAVYPPKLKQTVIADTLWSAEFSLAHARSFAQQGDIYNTAGCFTRVASNLIQALFALNEVYFIRDKKVFNVIDQLTLRPDEYSKKVEAILAHPGSSAAELEQSTFALTEVWRAVTSLPGVNYIPKFNL